MMRFLRLNNNNNNNNNNNKVKILILHLPVKDSATTTMMFLIKVWDWFHTHVNRQYRVIHKSLRNFRNQLRNNQDRNSRKDILRTCKVGQKLGVSLSLLIRSFLPCLSWLLRNRVQKSRRDLWITLYNACLSSSTQRPYFVQDFKMGWWFCRACKNRPGTESSNKWF